MCSCSAAWWSPNVPTGWIIFNFLLLLLSIAVVLPLTSVPPLLCAPPSSVRLLRTLPLIGNIQAGGLACPAEPYSAACRLRGMYSNAALPSLSPFNWLTILPHVHLSFSLFAPCPHPSLQRLCSDAIDLQLGAVSQAYCSLKAEWWMTMWKDFAYLIWQPDILSRISLNRLGCRLNLFQSKTRMSLR